MADNVGYTEGSGKTIAADDVGGILYQRIKPVVGADGTAVDVSSSNPMPIAAYGELIEAIQALRMCVVSMQRNNGFPDSSGRIRVNAESVGNMTTVTTLTTCSTVTNLSNIGSIPAESSVRSWAAFASDSLRRNITVTA